MLVSPRTPMPLSAFSDRRLTLIVLSTGAAGDDPLVAKLLGENAESGLVVVGAGSLDPVRDAMGRGDADAVLYVPVADPDTASAHVRQLHTANPQIPVLLIVETIDHALAVHCISEGAQDCIVRGDLEPIQVRRAIAYANARRREVERQELDQLMSWYNGLSGAGATTSVTRDTAQARSLAFVRPDERAKLRDQYAALFAQYMDALAIRKAKPRQQMSRLSTMLGDLGASPRDLIDVHSDALAFMSQKVSARRTAALAVNGRLLALEMMGLLVDYYRLGVRTPDLDGPDAKTSVTCTGSSYT